MLLWNYSKILDYDIYHSIDTVNLFMLGNRERQFRDVKQHSNIQYSR